MANIHNYILKYVENLQSQGRYVFSLKEVKSEFNKVKTGNSLSMALLRLSQKGKIVSVKKGVYVIVPPEYAGSEILSPYLFINDMMKYSGREYYLGLLSAAAFHGAAHQQPQEICVVTTKPSIRTILVRGVKINFICRENIRLQGIEERKTDTGYIRISGPELTAVDLIQFRKRGGELIRVTEVIGELLDKLDSKKLKKLAHSHIPIPVIQRFGYILDNVFKEKLLADALFNAVKSRLKRLTALNPSYDISSFKSENRWKIIENTILEPEE